MALSYSRAYTTADMRRLTCTFRGDYVHTDWYRVDGGFTTNGDSSLANKYNTVTIVTPEVTATGWNNSGSTTYNLYCVLYTPFGTYQSTTQNVEWYKDPKDNRTLTFVIENVLGEWTKFEIWAQQWTWTTNSHYLYWFNNSGGTVTVTYTESSNGKYPTVGMIQNSEGKWASGKYYVWKTSDPTTYYYPETAMTSDNSSDCIASCSSTYNTSFPAWRCFDKIQDNNCWASTAADTERWIQLVIPRKLYNIKVRITNPNGTNGPITGVIYGSNNGGSSLTQIGSFTNRDATANYTNTIICNNSGTAYDTVRIKTTTAGAINLNNLAIGEILIMGTDIGTNGSWVEAEPAVWITRTPKTYTYPEAGMTEHISQNCIACASTELNQNYPAWKAFNKATGSGDIWFAGDTPTPHWLQLTMPKQLYNISVQLTNRFANDHRGAIDGIVYGSNDNGATLTQIGSFSGRSPNYGVTTTITCNNTTTAYNTVRIKFTKWGDASGTAVTTTGMGVGAMIVSGTDLGTNGGWSNLSNYPKTVVHPKGAMNANIALDCVVTASSFYDSGYQPFGAFNKNASSVWCSTNADTSPWLLFEMPEPLYNISFTMINRVHASYPGGSFIDFSISGSNDGNSFTKIFQTTGRNGTTSGAASGHAIGNKTAYRYLKFVPTNWGGKGSNYCGIGDIYLFGTKKP